MIGIDSDCPAVVCLLADHLDAALAVGEDMLALELAPRADLDEADPATAPEALDKFVHRLRQLELSLMARVLQARRRLSDVIPDDGIMRASIGLFRAQTALLVDFVDASVPGPDSAITRAGDSFSFLRERGVIPPEQAAPSPFERMAITDDYKVGGQIHLGPLLDLVSSQLDLLDAKYGLYGPGIDDEALIPARSIASDEDRDTSVEEIGDQVPAAAPTVMMTAADIVQAFARIEAESAMKSAEVRDEPEAAGPETYALEQESQAPDLSLSAVSPNFSGPIAPKPAPVTVKPPVPAVPPSARMREARAKSLKAALAQASLEASSHA